MFTNRFHGQHYLFVQRIKKNLFCIEVYKDMEILVYYERDSPIAV